jgi:hypothetical protein
VAKARATFVQWVAAVGREHGHGDDWALINPSSGAQVKSEESASVGEVGSSSVTLGRKKA